MTESPERSQYDAANADASPIPEACPDDQRTDFDRYSSCFRPAGVIAGSRVPTSEIAERFQAGESPGELAEDFGRTEDEIWEAIRCEFPTAA